MCFLKKFLAERRRKKDHANCHNDTISTELNTATLSLDALFADPDHYIDASELDQWQYQWRYLSSADGIIRTARKMTAAEKNTLDRFEAFQQRLSELADEVNRHNDAYITARLENIKKMILPIEGKNLDAQQLACILKEGRNHQVVAGAGTGKTITVIGKIKFLLKAEKYKPAEILVLSFTNASATEMCQRINKETGENIAAMTFHKLGMNIITAVNGVKPNITQINLSTFVKETLNQLLKDPIYLRKFIQYLSFYRIREKSAFDFQDQTEYQDYLSVNQPVTLKNEVVKSYGEMEIANYLYQKGINYQYERPYQTDTATIEYARYVPDFYLPDADLYLEYFGIDRKGQVPDYFTAKANKTATQSYQQGMAWKRKIHAENNTTMLELYAYDHLDGKLIQVLEEKLLAAEVVFKPKSDAELWAEIKKSQGHFFENLGQLFETVISLVKINNQLFDQLYQLNRIHQGHQLRSNYRIIELIEPVFKAYQTQLEKNNEIDFNDMINLATKYVISGQYRHYYGYVIVDEYQDISRARYNLLKAMRNQSDFGLFCVGDDWQSIYGFAGSDINYILDFESYWGAAEASKIETTYRFSRSLIDVSGHFVMKNPKQIKKKLSAVAAGRSHPEGEFSLGLIEGHNERSMVTFMEATIMELPQNSSVFFIGRYNHDIKLFDQSPFKCQYDNRTGKTQVSYPSRTDLQMEFLSAHRSKGLQADYVFILNNKEKSYGFPSKIQNDAVVQLLLDDTEDYLYSEERRLFYVAMTRTKKKAWLLVQDGNKSVFVKELMAGFPSELQSQQQICPKCGGSLVIRRSVHGEFWGCSNYHKGCAFTQGIGPKKDSHSRPQPVQRQP